MDNFESHHRSLDNLDLVRIAFFEKKKYSANARKSAQKIIQERGIPREEIVQFKNIIRSKKREERRNEFQVVKEEKGWFFAFLELLLNLFSI